MSISVSLSVSKRGLLWWSRMKPKGKRASQKVAVVERMRIYARIRVLILPTFFFTSANACGVFGDLKMHFESFGTQMKSIRDLKLYFESFGTPDGTLKQARCSKNAF